MSSRGRPPKNGTPFERLLKRQCQKGVAASKSAGVVGKWGSASFTSIRSASSGSDSSASRPKKFFKSKNTAAVVVEAEEEQDLSPIVSAAQKTSKFFTSKNQTVVSSPPPPALTIQPLVVQPNAVTMSRKTRHLLQEDTSKNLPQPQPQQQPPETLKVPPLKLRFKATAAAAMVMDPIMPEPSCSSSNDEADNSGEEEEDEEEVSFKEPVVKYSKSDNGIAIPSSSSSASKQSPSSPKRLRTKSPPPIESTPLETLVQQRLSPALVVARKPAEPILPVPRTYGQRRRTGGANASSKPPSSGLEKPRMMEEEPPGLGSEQELKVKSDLEVAKCDVIRGPISDGHSLFKEQVSQDDLKSADESGNVEVPKVVLKPPLGPVHHYNKRSIFKSKSQSSANGGGTSSSGSGGKKGLSLYRHQFGSGSRSDKDSSKDDGDAFRAKVFHRAITAAGDDTFGGGGPSPSDMSFSSSKLVRVTCSSDPSLAKASSSSSSSLDFDGDGDGEVVSVKCPKGQKEYFTVIKNVKKAHQIQDSGEFQEFNDDVDYIMDGLQRTNNLSTRCLSTVTLASKCMEPPFRMHLRAHGTMNKFFAELKDAPDNASLALTTATVLFVLSQDRLNMDLDRDSLELMLNLLDTDSRIKDALDGAGLNRRELEKNKHKVQELCAAMKAKGHAVNLSIEHISADHLSMETLLSLTSKRAGEWFKEELRELGGLDHLVKTMSDCVDFLAADDISMWTDPLHTKLKKADRVLKVLESVTHENEENCQYLLEYQGGKFLDLIHTLFKLLDEEVPLNDNQDTNDKGCVGHTLRESLFDVMRVYINLVHDYKHMSTGSYMAGEKSDTFDLVLHCLFVMPDYLPPEKRFDIHVLTLTLIINLVEHSETNRKRILKARVPGKVDDLFSVNDNDSSAAAGFVRLFLQKEENARKEETKTDAILDGVKEEDGEQEEKKKEEEEQLRKKTEQEVIDETVAKLLQKAGRHMEDTLIAAYITLIVGYLILDNKDHEESIRRLLPDNNFAIMASVLKKFFNFMNLTASATVASNRGIKATEMILKHLEKIDQPEPVKSEIKNEESFDDISLFDMTKEEDEESTTVVAANSSFDEFGKL